MDAYARWLFIELIRHNAHSAKSLADKAPRLTIDRISLRAGNATPALAHGLRWQHDGWSALTHQSRCPCLRTDRQRWYPISPWGCSVGVGAL